jgi:hypothetical protein
MNRFEKLTVQRQTRTMLCLHLEDLRDGIVELYEQIDRCALLRSAPRDEHLTRWADALHAVRWDVARVRFALDEMSGLSLASTTRPELPLFPALRVSERRPKASVTPINPRPQSESA